MQGLESRAQVPRARIALPGAASEPPAKKAKKLKDPNHPKRPTSAYFFFSQARPPRPTPHGSAAGERGVPWRIWLNRMGWPARPCRRSGRRYWRRSPSCAQT